MEAALDLVARRTPIPAFDRWIAALIGGSEQAIAIAVRARAARLLDERHQLTKPRQRARWTFNEAVRLAQSAAARSDPVFELRDRVVCLALVGRLRQRHQQRSISVDANAYAPSPRGATNGELFSSDHAASLRFFAAGS